MSSRVTSTAKYLPKMTSFFNGVGYRRFNFYTKVSILIIKSLSKSDDVKIRIFLPIFDEATSIKPKIRAVPVIRSNPNFQGLFVSKLN